MLLIALIGLAIWVIASIPAGLLFGRMATLEEQGDLAAQAESANDRAAIPLQLDRDRAA